MPRALLTLMWLNLRAMFRRMVRGARTVRGMFFLLLGVLSLSLWIAPSFVASLHGPAADPANIRTIGPFAILGFCLMNLFASLGDRAIAFTGAEVDFLFPGPFTRRSLLLYKIAKTGLGTFFTAVIFSLILQRYRLPWIPCFVGVWITIQFVQLFSMTVIMIGQTLGEQLYSGARRLVLVAVLVLLLVAGGPQVVRHLGHEPVQMMQRIHASPMGRVLLAPFDVFVRIITMGSSAREWTTWVPLGLLIDLAMLAVVVGLDANYLETAATASQRRYERLQRMRSGGAGAFRGPGAGAMARIHLPMLPISGGAGPIVWRQMTTALRTTRSLFLLLGIVAILAVTVLTQHHSHTRSSLPMLIGTVVWMNVVFISMLRFDFRDELDRLDFLRSLPIRAEAIALGEVITPVVVLTGMQLILLIIVAFVAGGTLSQAVLVMAFAVPFNLLLTGIENLLFLMFPVRAVGLVAGDMQLFGRQMVVFVLKFLLLLVGCGTAAVVGTIGYILGNRSWVGFAAAAWPALVLVALSTIPLLARAFSRFDPSVDTPT